MHLIVKIKKQITIARLINILQIIVIMKNLIKMLIKILQIMMNKYTDQKIYIKQAKANYFVLIKIQKLSLTELNQSVLKTMI